MKNISAQPIASCKTGNNVISFQEVVGVRDEREEDLILPDGSSISAEILRTVSEKIAHELVMDCKVRLSAKANA